MTSVEAANVEQRDRDTGKTFFIETWGCQMNDLDTQRLAGQLRLRGYTRVNDQSEASLIMLNTCSIREKSEQKVFSRLGRLREEKARGAIIGVSGCVAQQEGERILKRAPHVNFVIGPGNVGNLDEVLSGARTVAIDFPEEREYDYISIERPSAVRAQVTVIEGCNKNCTFCIVPTTRGREVSRTITNILDEVSHSVGEGRSEIELLGQTVNGYRCPASGDDFAQLLQAVAATEGVRRVRFMTSHPAEVSDRMIAVMRDHANISRYFHLPVQSGSTTVLRRMKRLYTRERYLEIIAQIRAAIPEMTFSTDIIVGFPGESDEDFEQTLSLVRSVRFASIYAFKYSPRPGTPALRIGPPVDDLIASRRLDRLFELQNEIEAETLRGYVGSILQVLVDGASRHDREVLTGKSDCNWTVNFRSERLLASGETVAVLITEAKHHSLFGEVRL